MITKAMPLLLAATLAVGCTSRDTELKQFLEQTKREQPAGAEPLPEVKPYESFFYTVQAMRSPFAPGASGESSARGARPDTKRNREYLEQFALDSLQMVGTLTIGGKQYGLVRTADGLVQRVLAGNYMGQSDGRVTQIEPSKISITEIVPDGLGSFMERNAALGLIE